MDITSEDIMALVQEIAAVQRDGGTSVELTPSIRSGKHGCSMSRCTPLRTPGRPLRRWLAIPQRVIRKEATQMNDDSVFTRGPARRPAPRIADPTLQWSTGLPTVDRQLAAIWLLESGKHPALDEAMGLVGFGQVRIKHGGGNIVCDWALPIANLFRDDRGDQGSPGPQCG